MQQYIIRQINTLFLNNSGKIRELDLKEIKFIEK
jgi:hypothetical protein